MGREIKPGLDDLLNRAARAAHRHIPAGWEFCIVMRPRDCPDTGIVTNVKTNAEQLALLERAIVDTRQPAFLNGERAPGTKPSVEHQPCPACEGSGTALQRMYGVEWGPCDACGGTGRTRREAQP